MQTGAVKKLPHYTVHLMRGMRSQGLPEMQGEGWGGGLCGCMEGVGGGSV